MVFGRNQGNMDLHWVHGCPNLEESKVLAKNHVLAPLKQLKPLAANLRGNQMNLLIRSLGSNAWENPGRSVGLLV